MKAIQGRRGGGEAGLRIPVIFVLVPILVTVPQGRFCPHGRGSARSCRSPPTAGRSALLVKGSSGSPSLSMTAPDRAGASVGRHSRPSPDIELVYAKQPLARHAPQTQLGFTRTQQRSSNPTQSTRSTFNVAGNTQRFQTAFGR